MTIVAFEVLRANLSAKREEGAYTQLGEEG
jgi:hypothetical protein